MRRFGVNQGSLQVRPFSVDDKAFAFVGSIWDHLGRAGAKVGVGMLRCRGIPLVENQRVSSFEVSTFLGCSLFFRFLVSWLYWFGRTWPVSSNQTTKFPRFCPSRQSNHPYRRRPSRAHRHPPKSHRLYPFFSLRVVSERRDGAMSHPISDSFASGGVRSFASSFGRVLAIVGIYLQLFASRCTRLASC